MCFCDGYTYLVINKNTGEKHFIEGDKTLCEFFGDRYALPHLFHRLLKKEYVRLNDTLYHLYYNSHPECQRVKMQLVKVLAIEVPELCPKEYRHLIKRLKTHKVNME